MLELPSKKKMLEHQFFFVYSRNRTGCIHKLQTT